MDHYTFALALSSHKLVQDYNANRFMHSEGPEKFFEDWIKETFHSCTPQFEKDLMKVFIYHLTQGGVKAQNDGL